MAYDNVDAMINNTMAASKLLSTRQYLTAKEKEEATINVLILTNQAVIMSMLHKLGG